MIEFKNINYKKEYKELIETFIPDLGNRGLILVLEKIKNCLEISLGGYEDKLEIDDYFSAESSNIKRAIYKLLSTYTKDELEWGMLVGVNPLKLFNKLENEFGREESFNILKRGYFLSDNKIKLGYSILDNQKLIRRDLINKKSIYIDIPFCPTRCSYCSYATYKTENDLIEKYLDTLIYEIEKTSNVVEINPQNIYIGGGTPSSIGSKNLDKLLGYLAKKISKPEEFTVEIGRPDTIDKQILEVLKKYEVDRISINPQTMKDETLKVLGRNHSSENINEAFYLAREMGFNNINTDLIIGLPGETPKDFFDTLEKIKRLNPESISIHALALKKGSMLRESGYQSKKTLEFQKIRDDFIESNDYIPYYLYRQKNMYLNIENIGYSKINMESKYNIAMMEDLQNIIGFGLGSTTKIIENDKIFRHMNYRRLADYVENIDKNIEAKLELLGG